MPRYQIRKVETYTLELEATDAEVAEVLAEETPEYDWRQGDGPEYTVVKLSD